MAITGYLEEIIKNNKFNKPIKTGLEYLHQLKENDFKDVDINDKSIVKISGNKIYAINSIYITKGPSEQKFEGHKRYIDLQYIIEGEELINLASIKDSVPVSGYDPKKDVCFFDVKHYSTLLLTSGMIAIFFPDDIHAPGLKNKRKGQVKKSVIKVRY